MAHGRRPPLIRQETKPQTCHAERPTTGDGALCCAVFRMTCFLAALRPLLAAECPMLCDCNTLLQPAGGLASGPVCVFPRRLRQKADPSTCPGKVRNKKSDSLRIRFFVSKQRRAERLRGACTWPQNRLEWGLRSGFELAELTALHSSVGSLSSLTYRLRVGAREKQGLGDGTQSQWHPI